MAESRQMFKTRSISERVLLEKQQQATLELTLLIRYIYQGTVDLRHRVVVMREVVRHAVVREGIVLELVV